MGKHRSSNIELVIVTQLILSVLTGEGAEIAHETKQDKFQL